MAEKVCYQGKYITVKEEHGHDFCFERAYLLPSVQVIPIVEDGKILMIREHRQIEGRSRWKFVAGFCDKEGLSAEECAQEELMEEAGFVAGRLVKWHTIESKHTFILPITYYLAYDLRPQKKDNPDNSVVEEVKAVSIQELYERVLAGEFDFQHEASIILKLWRERDSLLN
ncbi:MAG: NUDIX hydrolase [Candidatus Auribacter fodinae]|uniref:NUDIX hydrolase n=1 Tax=Candidatus Auribacter fodinae TaxID=2093366 RepID=A0A3A4QSG3_9BACT|nr:MAG: NUDIX hydrolase [Candidatus Auribacter fodinae]